MSSSAITNRAIRSIKTELEFLAESNLLSQEDLQQILSLLPEPSESKSQTTTAGAAYAIPQAPVATTSVGHVKPALPIRKSANNPLIKSPPTPTPEPPALTPSPAPPPYDPSEVLLEARYDFTGTQPDDLPFKAGDQIVLNQKINDDWWSGRSTKTNQEGIFPASYVKIVSEGKKSSSGYDDNMMVNVAHEGRFGPECSGKNEGHDADGRSKFGEQGKKFGSKLGNAAIFGAGATIGSKIVSGIF